MRVEQFKTARALFFFVPDVKSAPWLSRRSFAEAIIARTAPHAGWNTTIASTTRRSASPAKDSAPAKVRIGWNIVFPNGIWYKIRRENWMKLVGKLITIFYGEGNYLIFFFGVHYCNIVPNFLASRIWKFSRMIRIESFVFYDKKKKKRNIKSIRRRYKNYTSTRKLSR